MKAGAVAIGCAMLVLGAVWALEPTSSATNAIPAARAAKQAKASPVASRNEGRVLLTDSQLRQAMASGTIDRPVKSLLSVPTPLQYGDYVWNDTGIPNGPTWVRVDLRGQLIFVFRAGHEIGTAVIVYGGDNKQTPIGKLHILAKARDHRSSSYEADMPYTLRLTEDGVSIHASNVRWAAATHGCIGVPLGFARRLFDAAQVGDEVIVIPSARTS